MDWFLFMANFHEALAQGKVGESEIARWLIKNGKNILPIYEISDYQFKGPALYCANGDSIIAPDMAVFSEKGLVFIEAKHKNAFSWYRNKGIWTTGIDKHHYNQYILFRNRLGFPVWILFLHRGGVAKDSPPSPAGLFGNNLSILSKCIDHESDRYGKHGMVYWNKESLIKLSDYPL